jgi:hypothetical protein
MTRTTIGIPVTAALAVLISGCQVVEGIFKVGFWAGAIMFAVVLAAILFLVRLIR